MPSIGAALEYAAHVQIERAIDEQFADDAQKEDARTLLALASTGGSTWHMMALAMAALLPSFLLFIPEIARKSTAAAAAHVVIAILFALLALFFYRRRRNARREYDALMKTDPLRWRPIARRLRAIVLEAGKFGSRQYTRIID